MFIDNFTSEEDKSFLRSTLPVYRLAAKINAKYGLRIGCKFNNLSQEATFSIHNAGLKSIGHISFIGDNVSLRLHASVKRRRRTVWLEIDGKAPYVWNQLNKHGDTVQKQVNEYDPTIIRRLIAVEHRFMSNQFGNMSLFSHDVDADLYMALVQKHTDPEMQFSMELQNKLYHVLVQVNRLVKARQEKMQAFNEINGKSRYLYFYTNDVGYVVMKSKLTYPIAMSSDDHINEEVEIPPVAVRKLEDLRGGPLEPAFVQALMMRSVYQKGSAGGDGMLLTAGDRAEEKLYPEFGAMIEHNFFSRIQTAAYIVA